MTLGTLPIADFRQLGTDWGRGWSNSLIESPLYKRFRVQKYLFENPPYRVFLAAAAGRSCVPPPPDGVAPPAATLLRPT
jgi:hypothetical protein